MPDMTTEALDAQLRRDGYTSTHPNGFKNLIYNVRSQVKNGRGPTHRLLRAALPTRTALPAVSDFKSDVLVGTAKFIREHGSETLVEAGRLIKSAGTDFEEYVRLVEAIQTIRD